jgi:hypothetical protein
MQQALPCLDLSLSAAYDSDGTDGGFLACLAIGAGDILFIQYDSGLSARDNREKETYAFRMSLCLRARSNQVRIFMSWNSLMTKSKWSSASARCFG